MPLLLRYFLLFANLKSELSRPKQPH